MISIIIPTLNEAERLEELLPHLNNCHKDAYPHEIIVVDGGSKDDTVSIATKLGARVLNSPLRRRSVQLNYGAAYAEGNILYFLHADTTPPPTYLSDIRQAVLEHCPVGCFRFRFRSGPLLLRINAFFTRFDGCLCCRGGDQSLYVTREVFMDIGGFREDYEVMEDYEFIERVRGRQSFYVIPKSVSGSARKYRHNSYLRVQLANLIAFNMYRFGYDTGRIRATYAGLLRYRDERYADTRRETRVTAPSDR